MRCRITLLLIAASAAPLASQNPPRDTLRAIPLDTVRVTITRSALTADRTPAAVSALGRGDVQGTRLGIGLDESLAVVPGVSVNNRYNFALGPRIAIRGFGSRTAFGVRGIRVIADGIPLTMPDGQTNLNNLDLGSAGVVEILRGPASALWGNAAGGVVLVRSEAAPAQFATEARAIVGDMGHGSDDLTNLRKFQLKLGGTQGPLQFLANASNLDVGGYRSHAQGRVRLLNTKARWALDDLSALTAVFSAADFPIAQNPGSLPIDSARRKPQMAWPANVRTQSGEATRQLQAGLSYERSIGSGQLDIAVHGLDRSLENPLPFAYIQLDRRAGGVRAAYAGSALHGPHVIRFTAGTDFEAQSDERREFDNANGSPGTSRRRDQTDGVTALGPFAQASVDFSQHFATTAGVRYDRVRFSTTDKFLGDGTNDSGERNLSASSWFAGLTLSPASRFTGYANVATTFQTPTTTEIINTPPAAGQPCCPAGFNTALEPQRATSFEAGARARLHARVALEASAYTMDVRNALVPFEVSSAPGRTFFRNAAKTRHRGLEFALHARSGAHQATAAYTYSHFTFVDDGNSATSFEGNQVPGVAPHHLHVRTRSALPLSLVLELELDHTSSYHPDDANTAPENPAANIADVRLSFSRRLGSVRAEPFLAIQNLTNETYFSSVVVNAAGGRYYEPAPRRNIYLGLTLATGGWAAR
jgi:iron complex outermembrane receptor protein